MFGRKRLSDFKDNKEDKLVEMMQAFNKKLDDLQKDLEKVKRNQAGTQRNTRISDIKKDNECFKCGQKGHWKRECKEVSSAPVAPLRCARPNSFFFSAL
jgi:hypothetical protein